MFICMSNIALFALNNAGKIRCPHSPNISSSNERFTPTNRRIVWYLIMIYQVVSLKGCVTSQLVQL